MGAPGGGLEQCAQGWGQDRTCGVSPHMPKATFPFVTARQWVDGWRLFFLNTATVSAGHSSPCKGLYLQPRTARFSWHSRRVFPLQCKYSIATTTGTVQLQDSTGTVLLVYIDLLLTELYCTVYRATTY